VILTLASKEVLGILSLLGPCQSHARTWAAGGNRDVCCIDFQQAASSIYVKALLVQFKPCLS